MDLPDLSDIPSRPALRRSNAAEIADINVATVKLMLYTVVYPRTLYPGTNTFKLGSNVLQVDSGTDVLRIHISSADMNIVEFMKHSGILQKLHLLFSELKIRLEVTYPRIQIFVDCRVNGEGKRVPIPIAFRSIDSVVEKGQRIHGRPVVDFVFLFNAEAHSVDLYSAGTLLSQVYIGWLFKTLKSEDGPCAVGDCFSGRMVEVVYNSSEGSTSTLPLSVLDVWNMRHVRLQSIDEREIVELVQRIAEMDGFHSEHVLQPIIVSPEYFSPFSAVHMFADFEPLTNPPRRFIPVEEVPEPPAVNADLLEAYRAKHGLALRRFISNSDLIPMRAELATQERAAGVLESALQDVPFKGHATISSFGGVKRRKLARRSRTPRRSSRTKIVY